MKFLKTPLKCLKILCPGCQGNGEIFVLLLPAGLCWALPALGGWAAPAGAHPSMSHPGTLLGTGGRRWQGHCWNWLLGHGLGTILSYICVSSTGQSGKFRDKTSISSDHRLLLSTGWLCVGGCYNEDKNRSSLHTVFPSFQDFPWFILISF